MFHRTATLVALLSLTLCSCSKSLAKGRGYTVPIPSGFVHLKARTGNPQTDSVVEAGGVVLAERERPALANAFQGSLVVAPIPRLTDDPADPTFCNNVSHGTAQQVGAKIERAGVVELKFGKTCQWETTGLDNPLRGGKGTIVSGPSAWMVVCNYDVRDQLAREGCDRILEGWKFTTT